MLELCFLKVFFFFIITQLHFCWLAQRRCNKMHKEEMCEEALSSVCVVNKILCLFNQNQTVVLHHLMPPIEQTRPASLPGKRNPPGGFAQSLRFSVHQLLCCLFLISYSHFLAFPSSHGRFGKKSVAPRAWWAVGLPDFKAFLAIFALRRTCQSVTCDAINIQHSCLCATVATEPCIIAKNVFDESSCRKGLKGIFCLKVDLKHQKHIRQIQLSLHLFHIHTAVVFADLNALEYPKRNDLLLQRS